MPALSVVPDGSGHPKRGVPDTHPRGRYRQLSSSTTVTVTGMRALDVCVSPQRIHLNLLLDSTAHLSRT